MTKRYDKAQTPFARVLASSTPDQSSKARIRKKMRTIHPGDLFRQIASLTEQLEHLALTKAPAPVKPKVNRAFNEWHHPEVLDEAMNQASRRI